MERVSVNIVIPLTPPSANHYKIPTRREQEDGRRIYKYTPEAKAWFKAFKIFAKNQTISGSQHRVEFCVYRGKGERGDIDNYTKCVLDGLQKSHVIRNDDSVVELHCYKERDRDNPRTEIEITEVNDGAPNL